LKPRCAVGRLHSSEIGRPNGLDRAFDNDRQAERDEQRIERTHAKSCEQPLQRDADGEKPRRNDQQGRERIDAAHRDKLVAQVRGEKREGEVRQVDLSENAPRKRESESEQPIERAHEHAGQDGLRNEACARELHHRLVILSEAKDPGDKPKGVPRDRAG
jgi:hypothetical protein